jgi:hypothetical protein
MAFSAEQSVAAHAAPQARTGKYSGIAAATSRKSPRAMNISNLHAACEDETPGKQKMSAMGRNNGVASQNSGIAEAGNSESVKVWPW